MSRAIFRAAPESLLLITEGRLLDVCSHWYNTDIFCNVLCICSFDLHWPNALPVCKLQSLLLSRFSWCWLVFQALALFWCFSTSRIFVIILFFLNCINSKQPRYAWFMILRGMPVPYFKTWYDIQCHNVLPMWDAQRALLCKRSLRRWKFLNKITAAFKQSYDISSDSPLLHIVAYGMTSNIVQRVTFFNLVDISRRDLKVSVFGLT